MQNDYSAGLPVKLWNHLSKKEWELAKKLLADDFEAAWPQSNEKIVGSHNFIEVNSTYPGKHEIEVLNWHSSYDQWDHKTNVVTEVLIRSQYDDGRGTTLFAISFFEVYDDKITSAREYWADCYPAPEWRRHLVEKL